MQALAIWAEGVEPSYVDLFDDEDNDAAADDEDAADKAAG